VSGQRDTWLRFRQWGNCACSGFYGNCRLAALASAASACNRSCLVIQPPTGCEIIKVYKDHSISGTRGRDQRPAFDKLCRDAARARSEGKRWGALRLPPHSKNEFVRPWRLRDGRVCARSRFRKVSKAPKRRAGFLGGV
jgi:hypothetical protein